MADNQFIIRKGLIALDDSQITGSLSVTNSVTASFFTGSYRGDGSQLTGIEGFPFTGSAGITGSLTVVGPVNATTFTGDGSQLTGIEGFPFTGSAKITGSLEVTGSVTATSFTGSIQGTATSASYVQLANIDGFTAYSASVNTAIDSVLDATTPLTATVNTTNSPFTVTSQSIVIIDSTNGDVTVNLPDLNTINGTPSQKPILLYKNDYSQNVIYVQPSGSQLVNGTTQDIIVSIQIAIAYNPTSAGWVTEGTSYQSLAELEMFFVPRTETGSFATTGSNQFSGSQTITGSLTVTGNITGNITGSASTASYVEYANVANKPAIVSGSSQISFNGITDKPTLVSGSEQITYSGLTGIPSGIVSGSAQIASFGIFATTGSNQFNGNQSITGSLTVSGQVVAQTLNVQQVTSSIVYSSGSNIFGNSVSNTQQFTGSLQVSGSSHYLLGSVGVGTTSLVVDTLLPLQINAGASGQAYFASNNNGGYGLLMGYDNANGYARIRNVSNTALTFETNNSEKMRLDSTGNLGLGVTPSTWTLGKAIEVGNVGNGIWNYSASNTNIIANSIWNNGSKYASNGAATQYAQNNGNHEWLIAPSGTAGNAISFTQAMTLNASGNLSIGNTNDTYKLDVSGTGRFKRTDGDARVIIEQTNTSAPYTATLELSSQGLGTYGGTIQYDAGPENLTIENYGRSASGLSRGDINFRTKVGNTTPTNVLNLNGFTGAATFSSTTFSIAKFNSTYGQVNIDFQNSGTTFASIGSGVSVTSTAAADDTGIGTAGLNKNIVFATGASYLERMRITSGGNVGIGTANPQNRLTVNTPLRNDGETNTLGALVVAGAISSSPSYDFTNSTSIFRIQGSDATNNLQFGIGGEVYNFHPWIQGSFDNSTAGSPSFGPKDILLQPIGGRIGVGSLSPSNVVDIYDTSQNSPTVGILGARTRGGGTFITGRTVPADTSNQTVTIATMSASGGNERIFIKVQVVNVSAVNNYGNVHVGYALWSSSGGSSVTTMTLDTGNSNIGNSLVGTLSWSGNNLQYSTNRLGNYELNSITIWASARDTGVVT